MMEHIPRDAMASAPAATVPATAVSAARPMHGEITRGPEVRAASYVVALVRRVAVPATPRGLTKDPWGDEANTHRRGGPCSIGSGDGDGGVHDAR